MRSKVRLPTGRAANDPSTDRLPTFVMRYTWPLAIVGIVLVVLYTAWVVRLWRLSNRTRRTAYFLR